MEKKRRAVFLDRDGTLNIEVNYLHRTDNFEWIDGAPRAVKRLNDLGIPVIVITNQAGVAHGYFEESKVKKIHNHIKKELKKIGAKIDDFYYCPYHPHGKVKKYKKKSKFRKPKPGMYKKAIEKWKIEPGKSFVVGDKSSDLIPGKKLGMNTIKVRTGHSEKNGEEAAQYVAGDITDAVEIIEKRTNI